MGESVKNNIQKADKSKQNLQSIEVFVGKIRKQMEYYEMAKNQAEALFKHC